MKKMMTLVMMMTIAISAAAMPYNTARNEAMFLSDKMAYELGLTATQYEAVYEINLDYLLNVNTRADVLGFWWEVRNRDLRYVLSTWQYDNYMASEWFYRPIIWHSGGISFSIYTRYNTGRMFYDRPTVYVNYKGGHSHKSNSFYAGHHFDKPNPPKGNGNHNPSMGNGNRPPKGNGIHNPTIGNGNRPATGNGGHKTTASTVTGSNNRSTSVSTPTRTFGGHSSGNVASKSAKDNSSSGSNATRGVFGGTRK